MTPQNSPVGNFGVVVPGKLYRGAQPADSAFAALKAGFGVSTVIDLRQPFGREDEAAQCAALDIRHVNIPIGTGSLTLGVEPPTADEIRQIFALIQAPDAVCFVHCEHGEDRTGAVVAAYRIQFQKLTNIAALAEAEQFHISPLQLLIRHWIKEYQPS